MFLIHLHVNHPNVVLQEPLFRPKAPGVLFVSPPKPFFHRNRKLSFAKMQTNLNPLKDFGSDQNAVTVPPTPNTHTRVK